MKFSSKSKLYHKKAFGGLVEMVLVILVIAILATTVILGKNVIRKSRISSAQSITKSSIINSMETVALWLETSLEDSFISAEKNNGSSLGRWKDLKNYGKKIDAFQTDDLNKPIYSNTINYIPTVKFDGTNSYLEFDGSFLNSSGYTIVVVEKRLSNKANNYFLGDSSISTENENIILGYKEDGEVIHSQGGTNYYSSSVATYVNSVDSPRVFSFLHKRNLGNKTYINGYLAAEDDDITNLSNVGNIVIGKGYEGEIGEIIVFNKALDVIARQKVEEYLSKKWSIKIADNSKSCIGGSIGDATCVAGCSQSVTGVSSPISDYNGSSGTAACDVVGYAGTLAYSCASSHITVTTPCACDSGYVDSAGICVATCPVSKDGVSITSVTDGSGSLSCDVSGYNGSVTYTCTAGSPANITGSCNLDPCTGGTITTVGGTTIHKFTSSGTLGCTIGRSAKVLVVAGGGGGGHVQHGFTSGGGGGGGVIYNASYSIPNGGGSVTVGAGGAGGSGAAKGGNSVFASLTAIGGGYSRIYHTTANFAGGSGGGGVDTAATGGSGTAGQGNKGGNSITYDCGGGVICRSIGGGGGAGQAGQDGQDGVGGKGGDGLSYDISGTMTTYGGGGGGNTRNASCSGVAGKRGAGGAGGGGSSGAGTANTGGGGGQGAAGGSGIVIISY